VLFCLGHAAKLLERRGAGLLPSHATLKIFLDREIDVAAELFVEIAIEFAGGEKCGAAAE
jgi:hypothetical protein